MVFEAVKLVPLRVNTVALGPEFGETSRPRLVDVQVNVALAVLAPVSPLVVLMVTFTVMAPVTKVFPLGTAEGMVKVRLNPPAVSVNNCGVDRLPLEPAWVRVTMLFEDAATLGGKFAPMMTTVPVRPEVWPSTSVAPVTVTMTLALLPPSSVTVTCLGPEDVPAGIRT
jgi:hypothetical protein